MRCEKKIIFFPSCFFWPSRSTLTRCSGSENRFPHRLASTRAAALPPPGPGSRARQGPAHQLPVYGPAPSPSPRAFSILVAVAPVAPGQAAWLFGSHLAPSPSYGIYVEGVG